METEKRHENYPPGTVLLTNLVSLAIYGLGVFVIFQANLVFALIFLIYILGLEVRLLKYHCTECYYWGKTCGFGKGRLSAWLFQKGDSTKFSCKPMTWKDMVPDMLVLLIPLVTGIVLLVLKFEILLLSALILLVLLGTTGNGFVRGKCTCNYCKQKDLGCPADQLFNKK